MNDNPSVTANDSTMTATTKRLPLSLSPFTRLSLILSCMREKDLYDCLRSHALAARVFIDIFNCLANIKSYTPYEREKNFKNIKQMSFKPLTHSKINHKITVVKISGR